MENKKILLISYYSFPNSTSQSVHCESLFNYLVSKYKDVHLVTAPWKDSRVDLKSNGTNIHYVSFGAFNSKIKKDNSVYVKKKKNLIHFVISSIIKSLFIPDLAIDWKSNAIKKIKSLNIDFDYVFSLATPFTDHIIAHDYIKKYSQRTKLVLVYADPWYGEASSSNFFIKRLIEKKIEKKILLHSSFVFMVTNNAVKYYSKIYPFLKNKIYFYYIGHNIDKSLFDSIKSFSYKNNSLELNYFGAIQKVHRNPFPFLKAFKEFLYNTNTSNIIVNFYLLPNHFNNKITQYINSDKKLQLNVKIMTPITYQNMITIASNSSINIVFGNKSNLQIPVKLFELASLKPKVLYLVDTYNHEINELFQKEVLMVNNSVPDIHSFLKNLNNFIDKNVFMPKNYNQFHYTNFYNNIFKALKK